MNSVYSYDPNLDTWSTEASLNKTRVWHSLWVANDRLYAGGGGFGTAYQTIEIYNPQLGVWEELPDQLPQASYGSGTAVLGDTLYLVGGSTTTNTTDVSNKVFATKLFPEMDLYFRDENGSGPITLDKLSASVAGQIANSPGVATPEGMVTAVEHQSIPPAEHGVLERTDRNATHEWEEMAPVSLARYAYDGVEPLGGKIYFGGGFNGYAQNLMEVYDPQSDNWQTLAPMNEARPSMAATVLNGKYYAIGGSGASVEVYDPRTDQWSTGKPLPIPVDHSTAISVNGKILLVGGRSSGQFIDKVFEYDPLYDQWIEKSPMSMARAGVGLVTLDGMIWAIGGKVVGASTDVVEVYDPRNDQWSMAPSIKTKRDLPSVWVSSGVIYVGGGHEGLGLYPLNSIERFDAARQQWVDAGNFPEIKDAADAAVVGDKVYVVSGKTLSSYSNKVYAADLLPHRDLYFRSVEGEPLNRAPSSLFAVGDLNISENQPIGTIVGDFNATDPDGDQIFYSLVDGDTVSISFTIDTNGTLRTAMEFDHELITSLSVVVRATDEHNASIEQQFMVLITNLNEAPNGGGSASLVLPESSDSQTFSSGWSPVDPDGDILSLVDRRRGGCTDFLYKCSQW
jgi:N-acetylneuraminic acid mutarotase